MVTRSQERMAFADLRVENTQLRGRWVVPLRNDVVQDMARRNSVRSV